MVFIGIDVSKLSVDAAALCSTGEVERAQFRNSTEGQAGLMEWLQRFEIVRIALEATGSYHQRLVAVMQASSMPVSVVNPAQVSYFVKSQHRRNKTDRVDALWLAVYAKERNPAPALVMNHLLSSLTREIQALTNDLARLKYRLEAAQAGQVHQGVVVSLKRRIAALEEEKRALEGELERETRRSNEHELSLLLSIPGVGVRTACCLLAELGDIRRFASARKLVAFAGLTAAQFESGSSVVRRSRISKLGSSHLRRLLYMPCLSAMRHNPVIRAFFEGLVSCGKNRKVALVACMGKLLKIVYGVLVDRQPFRSPQLRA